MNNTEFYYKIKSILSDVSFLISCEGENNVPHLMLEFYTELDEITNDVDELKRVTKLEADQLYIEIYDIYLDIVGEYYENLEKLLV